MAARICLHTLLGIATATSCVAVPVEGGTSRLRLRPVPTDSGGRVTRANRLVDDLGHPWFQRRQAATRELKRIGAKAVRPLLQAGEGDRFEVARQARRLLVEMAVSRADVVSKLLWCVRVKAKHSRLAAKVLSVRRVTAAHDKRVRANLKSLIASSRSAIQNRKYADAIDSIVTAGRIMRQSTPATRSFEDVQVKLMRQLCRAGFTKQVAQSCDADSQRRLIESKLDEARRLRDDGKFRLAQQAVKFCKRFRVEPNPFRESPDDVAKSIVRAAVHAHRHLALRLVLPSASVDMMHQVDTIRRRVQIHEMRRRDIRARQLIFHSEDLRHVPEIWERAWEMEMPDVTTPYRTHGGVI